MTIGVFIFSVGKFFNKIEIKIFRNNFIDISKDKNVKQLTENHKILLHIIGIFVLLISLFSDAVSQFLKEHQFDVFNPNPVKIMFLNNIFIFTYSLVICLPPFSKQFILSTRYFIKYPKIFGLFILLTMLHGFGQFFSYRFLKKYGAIKLVGINIVRKMFTVICSLILFHGGIELYKAIGGLLVFFSIILEFIKK